MIYLLAKYAWLWIDLCVIKSIIRPYLCWWSCPLIAVRGFTFTCAHNVNSLWRSICFEIPQYSHRSTLLRKYANCGAIHSFQKAHNQQSISVSRKNVNVLMIYFLINSCGDYYVFDEFSRCEHGTEHNWALKMCWNLDVSTRTVKHS